MASGGRRGVAEARRKGTNRADAGCGYVGVAQGREDGIGGIGCAADQDTAF